MNLPGFFNSLWLVICVDVGGVIAYLAAVTMLYVGLLAAGLAAGPGGREIVLPARLGRTLAGMLRPLFGGRRIDAITSGFATMFFIDPPKDLRVHEAFHRYQAAREIPGAFSYFINPPDEPIVFAGAGRDTWRVMMLLGAVIYGVRYALEYARHGYYANEFEAEARRAAGQD